MRTKHVGIAGRVLGLAAAAASAWLVASAAVFAFPSNDLTTPTDAIYFLASDGGVKALSELGVHASGTVVVSRPASIADNPRYAVCDQPGVVCLSPAPETTQGESEAFAAVAAERGWGSVTVVTQTTHVARARLLMKRCFPGTVHVVAVPVERTPLSWLAGFAHESLGMVKAALTPGCRDHLPWGD